jgi:3'-phosphoadenosine 5'-phosphosulfate sulfotransferase (PAPS reductase)/FAD synthetase
MLRKVLDAHNGQLPKDVHVIFSDTGQERSETYAFVRDCANQWGVDITWVERPGQFTRLITDKKYLPNVMARFCTQELKLTPMRKWMLARG